MSEDTKKHWLVCHTSPNHHRVFIWPPDIEAISEDPLCGNCMIHLRSGGVHVVTEPVDKVFPAADALIDQILEYDERRADARRKQESE